MDITFTLTDEEVAAIAAERPPGTDIAAEVTGVVRAAVLAPFVERYRQRFVDTLGDRLNAIDPTARAACQAAITQACQPFIRLDIAAVADVDQPLNIKR